MNNRNSRGNPSLRCFGRDGGGLRGAKNMNKNVVNKLAFPINLSGPLPAEWIFQRRFPLHAWILQGFCCCGFLCGFSVLRLKGRKTPRNPQKKIHTKIHDNIHALRMKIHDDGYSAEGQS